MNLAATPPAAQRIVAAARRHLQRRQLAVILGLCGTTFAVLALAVCVSDYPVPVDEVLRSLLSPVTGAADQATDFIVLGVRLPRAVTALLAGAAFGMSGVIFQTMLRNPLASPDIVGISTGASAAAVTCLLFFHWSGFAVSLGAFGGALLTAVLIYLLAYRNGVSTYRLVLIGIGIAAMASAVISYLFTRARLLEAQKALAWLTGSINGATFEGLMPLATAMLVLVPASLAMMRWLDSLQLGDDAAMALGTRVERSRLMLMLVAVALAAFATAAIGPVAFIAFVSGPIARRLLGPSGNALVPSALVGGIVTIGSDLVAQHLLGNNQLPVGVVTGAFGALFLIYLLIVSNRSGQGG